VKARFSVACGAMECPYSVIYVEPRLKSIDNFIFTGKLIIEHSNMTFSIIFVEHNRVTKFIVGLQATIT
jgi:hypothetical protein